MPPLAVTVVVAVLSTLAALVTLKVVGEAVAPTALARSMPTVQTAVAVLLVTRSVTVQSATPETPVPSASPEAVKVVDPAAGSSIEIPLPPDFQAQAYV